ncbi:MAG: hypothetical protein IJ461_07085 [Clostridia bacterium]|nr:hypothetical protein [Clostridia bacterium]
MSFWQKLKQSMGGFMQGRYGQDQFSLTLIYGGLLLYILDMFIGTGFISMVAMASYIYAIFRMMSRNKEKRRMENQRFLAYYNPRALKVKQAWKRFQNRKQYKYFKCPQCKSWLRLPHGAGEVNVTCGRCQNKFSYKA